MKDEANSHSDCGSEDLRNINQEPVKVPGLFSKNFRKNYWTHGTSVERIESSPVHRAVLEHAQEYRCSQSALVFVLIIPMCLIYWFTLGDNVKDPTGMYWWILLVFAGTTVRLIYCLYLRSRISTSSAKQLIRNENALLITALIPSIFVGAGSWLIASGGDEYAVLSTALSSCIYSIGHASSVSVYPFALHILLISNLGQTIAYHFGLGEGDIHPEIGALLCAQIFVLMTMSTKLYSFFRQSKASEYSSIRANAESQNTIESRNAFIRSASHDLSQPVAALTLLVGALKHANTPEEQVEVAHSMAQASKLLTEEVRKLDVGTGVDTSERTGITDVHELCETVASTESVKAPGVKITVDDLRSKIYVSTEYWIIARCISNAVNNAVRHSNTEQIVISFEESEEKFIHVCVKDFGEGMEPDLLDKVWDKKEGENEGMLGLASIRDLVTTYGIDVELESFPGKCTIFTMRLEKTDPPIVKSDATVNLSGSKILIVDDQIIIAEALESLLQKKGCETVIFIDPVKALHYAEFNTIDYAFIDDNLNSDIDGLSLGKMIPVSDHRIAIITGNAMRERRQHIETHYRILRKPFNTEEVESVFS